MSNHPASRMGKAPAFRARPLSFWLRARRSIITCFVMICCRFGSGLRSDVACFERPTEPRMPLPRPRSNSSHATPRARGRAWTRRRDSSQRRAPPPPTSTAVEARDAGADDRTRSGRGVLTLVLVVLASLPFLAPHIRQLTTPPIAYPTETPRPAEPTPYALKAAWRNIHRPVETRPQPAPAPTTDLSKTDPRASPAPASEASHLPADSSRTEAASLAERMASSGAPAASEADPTPPATGNGDPLGGAAEAAPSPQPASETEVTPLVPGGPDRESGDQADTRASTSQRPPPAPIETPPLPERNPHSRGSSIDRHTASRAPHDPVPSALQRASDQSGATRSPRKPRRRPPTQPPPLEPSHADPLRGPSLFQGIGRAMP